jgi:hypothetical protein
MRQLRPCLAGPTRCRWSTRKRPRPRGRAVGPKALKRTPTHCAAQAETLPALLGFFQVAQRCPDMPIALPAPGTPPPPDPPATPSPNAWLHNRLVPGAQSAWMYRIAQPYTALHDFKSFFLPSGLSADTDWNYVRCPFRTGAVLCFAFVGARLAAGRVDLAPARNHAHRSWAALVLAPLPVSPAQTKAAPAGYVVSKGASRESINREAHPPGHTSSLAGDCDLQKVSLLHGTRSASRVARGSGAAHRALQETRRGGWTRRIPVQDLDPSAGGT